MTKKILLILVTGVLSLTLMGAAWAEVTPTSVWNNFYGSATTYNGQPIPIGSVIDAYTTDNIHVGTWTVDSSGTYGFMPVYGNDDYTDGADEGETITFYINERLAVPGGPDSPTYSGSMGAVKHVNLSASATLGIEAVDMPEDEIVMRGDSVRFEVTVRNTGEGLDFYTIDASTAHSWVVHPMFGFAYAMPGETVTLHFVFVAPTAIAYEIDEEITFRVESGIDDSYFVEGSVMALVRIPTDVDDGDQIIPDVFQLNQNYPNPFNPTTTITFSLAKTSDTELEVFDLLGRQVEKMNLGRLGAGEHSVGFDGSSLASGVYFYRLTAGDRSEIRKMVLMK